MKIPKSLVFPIFIFSFTGALAQTSIVYINSKSEVRLHRDYALYEKNNSGVSEIDYTSITAPYASSNQLLITIDNNTSEHISTSAGDKSPVQVCKGESLTVYSTFTSSQFEYEFKRIRNNTDTSIQTRSSNATLTLSFSDYEYGDIINIEIFDMSVTPTNKFNSSGITVEILSLPSGKNHFGGGTINQKVQGIYYGDIPVTLNTSGEPTNPLFSYQWEYSLDNGENFSSIDGATNASYVFSEAVTRTTVYRRSSRWADGGTCIKYTNNHQVAVLKNNPGTILTSGQISICYDGSPPLIKNKTLATGNTQLQAT